MKRLTTISELKNDQFFVLIKINELTKLDQDIFLTKLSEQLHISKSKLSKILLIVPISGLFAYYRERSSPLIKDSDEFNKLTNLNKKSQPVQPFSQNSIIGSNLVNISYKEEKNQQTDKISYLIIEITLNITNEGLYSVSAELDINGDEILPVMFPFKAYNEVISPGNHIFALYYWGPSIWSSIVENQIAIPILSIKRFEIRDMTDHLFSIPVEFNITSYTSMDFEPSPVRYQGDYSQEYVDKNMDANFDGIEITLNYYTSILGNYKFNFNIFDPSSPYKTKYQIISEGEKLGEFSVKFFITKYLLLETNGEFNISGINRVIHYPIMGTWEREGSPTGLNLYTRENWTELNYIAI